jgi:hypothetical protein
MVAIQPVLLCVEVGALMGNVLPLVSVLVTLATLRTLTTVLETPVSQYALEVVPMANAPAPTSAPATMVMLKILKVINVSHIALEVV